MEEAMAKIEKTEVVEATEATEATEVEKADAILTINKGFKYRLYPTEEQKVLLAKNFGCNRLVWNMALESRNNLYEDQKKSTTWVNQANELKLLKETKKYGFLNEVNSQTLQQTLKQQSIAFTNFFRAPKQFGYPQFKSKYNRQSITIPQHIEPITDAGVTKICKLGNIPTVFHRPMEGTIKHATISKTNAGSYYISFCCEVARQPEKKPVTIETTIGIDLGLKSFCILSDGQKFGNPKLLKESLEKVKHEQRCLSRKKKGSASYKEQKLKLAKACEHVANQRMDFLQKLSHYIVGDSQTNTICVEDLNIKGMMKNHKLAKAIQDASWSEFVRLLMYKSDWCGKNLYKIGRFEASTKTCHVCGFKNNALTLEDREWLCPHCKTLLDRDVNAAINIKRIILEELGLLKPLVPGATLEQVKESPVEQNASTVGSKDSTASICCEIGKYQANLFV